MLRLPHRVGPAISDVLSFRSNIIINCDIKVFYRTAMFVSLIDIKGLRASGQNM